MLFSEGLRGGSVRVGLDLAGIRLYWSVFWGARVAPWGVRGGTDQTLGAYGSGRVDWLSVMAFSVSVRVVVPLRVGFRGFRRVGCGLARVAGWRGLDIAGWHGLRVGAGWTLLVGAGCGLARAGASHTPAPPY